MLEIRQSCENCNKALPANSNEAMICTFECTYCNDCVDKVLLNVCPNCGGGFEKRPVRPKGLLEKYPPRKELVFKPVDPASFSRRLNQNKNIDPGDR